MNLFRRSQSSTSSSRSVVGRSLFRVSEKLTWHHYALAGLGALLLAGGILIFAADSTTTSVNPQNPNNIQIGVMDSNGWGSAVSSYIKNAGVTWDRIDGTNTSLVNSALSAGYNVVIITPENPASAESMI